MSETKSLGKRWQQIRTYSAMANTGEIARRYFAMNAFDGVLTMIGVLMGNLSAGVNAPQIVVTTGLSTCVAYIDPDNHASAAVAKRLGGSIDTDTTIRPSGNENADVWRFYPVTGAHP